MSEYIVHIPDDMREYEELFVGNIREGQKLIRCNECRYFGSQMESGYWSCGRDHGCVRTIPEGFCGWAVPGVRKHTKQYKVKEEFCDLWNASEDDIIIEDEVKRIALECGVSVEQLLEQLEEV